jgi:hypothetical protein
MDTTITAPAAPRQRLEGTLHRSLPADITVRAAEPGAADDGLLRLRLAFSSEAPVLRRSFFEDDWVEILGHNPTEIDLGRMNNGSAVVLANHSRDQATGSTPLASIGVVERAWVEGGRLMADVAISRRDALADLRQDIADGLVRNVSIGYRINERVLTRAGGEVADEYRVTSWTPYEISLVDIPADATVGLGPRCRRRPNSHPAVSRGRSARPGQQPLELDPNARRPTSRRSANPIRRTGRQQATRSADLSASAASTTWPPSVPALAKSWPSAVSSTSPTWPTPPSTQAPRSTPSASKCWAACATPARFASPNRPRSA